MDAGQTTQNHVSYIFSKEVILKGLLEQGTISESDFERYDQMLYDRYHISASLGIPRPIVGERPDESSEKQMPTVGTKPAKLDYISLTAIAKEVNETSPGYLIQSWLRDVHTIEYLHCWELKNNPSFNEEGYRELEEEMKSPSTTLTAKKWILATSAIGLRSKLGKGGGTSAHPEIACAFRAWLYPEFQYELIQHYLAVNDEQGHESV